MWSSPLGVVTLQSMWPVFSACTGLATVVANGRLKLVWVMVPGPVPFALV